MRNSAIALWAAAVLALTAGPAGAACTMRLAGELPASLGAAGGVFTTVKVNGREVSAAVSIGGDESAVEGWALKGLRLTQVPVDAEMRSPQGTRGAYATVLDTLQLGGLTVKGVTLWVAGTPEQPREADAASVILGSKLLSSFDIEFDLPHHAIRLFKPEGCRDDEVLYWGGAYSVTPLLGESDGHFRSLIEVKLNKQPVRAKLSSGTHISFVASALARRLGAKDVPGGSSFVEEPLDLRPVLLDEFSLDQEASRNVVIEAAQLRQAYVNDGTGTRLSALYSLEDMTLGADFFAAHRLLIANSQNRLYLSYTGGPLFGLSPAPAKAE